MECFIIPKSFVADITTHLLFLHIDLLQRLYQQSGLLRLSVENDKTLSRCSNCKYGVNVLKSS